MRACHLLGEFVSCRVSWATAASSVLAFPYLPRSSPRFTHRDTGESRGTGKVEFESAQLAQSAIQAFPDPALRGGCSKLGAVGFSFHTFTYRFTY